MHTALCQVCLLDFKTVCEANKTDTPHKYYTILILVHSTFSPEPISTEQAKEIFDEFTALEEQHGHEFSGESHTITITLTLITQIRS